MSATNNVQVMYRHLELAAAAPLRDVGDGTFRLTLDAPPPVRTVLSIVSSGGARAYEVIAVAEVAADASTRGCVVREVAADRLPTTVGTEKLRDGSLGTGERSTAAPAASHDADSDADSDAYGAHMAVPAPVMGEDSSEPIDVDDADDGAGSAEPASDETATPADGASRGKKRRGRQRK